MSGEYSNQPVVKMPCKGKSNEKYSTEEVFEEAREKMSGEYSNLPVKNLAV